MRLWKGKSSLMKLNGVAEPTAIEPSGYGPLSHAEPCAVLVPTGGVASEFV